ncbi:hypothetical protein V866_005320 [Kwoniella sp. B9012]|uniref:Uncharacterized protein n=1 Tax=Kwoniella europaea PYCC6329 TaxID=1423913 RepID=A0AAX4KLB1_9TREE
MSFPHICDETKRSLSFLRPPEVISDYTNNYQDRTTRTFLLKCPTKSKRSECGKIGRLNITMSKNPDYMGEQLNNTVFLISFKCASCKEYMDLANDRFDPGSCNSVILGKSGLGKTNISSFQFDKIRGKL